MPNFPPLSDIRMTDCHDTNTQYSPPHFATSAEVDRRREELRFNLRMAAGLWPEPARTPLNAKYELVGEFEGYTLKKVMFESRPGFWSTGNLYLPRPLQGPCPAILNFVGHWEDQRLHRGEDGDFPQQIANFARMGFVCLVTDMIGKVDSRQLSHEYGARPEEEAWLSNGLGVQLWNNIRAIDLLCEMPEVDSSRIGATGASGGGSQTLFASLMDDRIRAAAPINMISLSMQGGCRCENAPGLRRHTNNLEMCAMIAPRPLFLAGSTGDWTVNQETLEAPALEEIYSLYGARDAFRHFYQDANHQYNAKTRHEVYQFFAKHLQGRDIVWQEEPIETGDLQDFTWFRGDSCAPGFRSDSEYLAADAETRTAAVAALSAEDKKRMLGWMVDVCEEDPFSLAEGEDTEGFSIEYGKLSDTRGAEVRYAKYLPRDFDGRSAFLFIGGEDGYEPVLECLEDGCAVIRANLFMTDGDGEPASRKAMYRSCFHASEDACRVQDVWMLCRHILSTCESLDICATDAAARAVAVALPLLPAGVTAHLDAAALKDAAGMNIPGLSLLGGVMGCAKLAMQEGKMVHFLNF
ncbi:MAG: acetylxylan esterase [Clostridia bacterium]|nr:acetylxylan esterase [Clostridia bacterium]